MSDTKVTESFLETQQITIKSYRRRWFILFLFVYYAAVNSFQWIEYSIITNIVMRYYSVSAVAVDWTSIIYMALYSPLVIPASFIIDKKGLRTAALIGCWGTTFGTFIKIFSIHPNKFFLVLIGQAIVSASQVVILSLPPRIAAVWFKPNEISTACCLGVFGTQLGVAIGFVVSPIVVKDHKHLDEISPELRALCWGLFIAVLPAALAVYFYFPARPPKPPSVTQANERSKSDKFTFSIFVQSLKALFTNNAFNIHMLAYGFNIAVSSAFGTLLNQFILQYFPGAVEDAGRMGLVMVLLGMVATVAFGVILDKTHKYKIMTFLIYFMSAISFLALMFSLELKSKLLVYITIASVGIFTTGYMAVGFEMGMELTFPSPESTTTGILMAMTQILGVINTLIAGKINSLYGTFWALGSQTLILIIGTVITAFIPNQLRRQNAFIGNDNKNHIEFKSISLNENELK